METLFIIVNNLICVLEAYLMVDFWATFLRVRKSLEFRYTKTITIMATAVVVRLVNSFDNPDFNLVAMQIIYFGVILIVFHGSLLKKVFCFLIADIIMIGCEFTWMIMMSYSTEFYIYDVEKNPSGTILVVLGLKVLTFLCFRLVKHLVKHKEYKMQMRTLVSYCITPLATVGMIYAIVSSDVSFYANEFLQMIFLVSAVLIVFANILTFYVFDAYASSAEKLRKQELLITRLELEEKRYEQMEAVNREHAGFLHDIRYYLQAIGAMATENKEQEILSILEELQIRISHASMEINCTDQLLNMIINEKKKEAKDLNIDLKIKIEPEFKVDYIARTDLIAIAGNLFDNAIEAAVACEEGFIKGYFYIQNEGNFSVIKIVNNYSGEIKTDGNEIVTGKVDKELHGYGLQNIKTATEKYGGSFQYFYQDDIFTAVVVLPNGKRLAKECCDV